MLAWDRVQSLGVCWRMEETVLYFLALRRERDGIAQKYPLLSVFLQAVPWMVLLHRGRKGLLELEADQQVWVH